MSKLEVIVSGDSLQVFQDNENKTLSYAPVIEANLNGVLFTEAGLKDFIVWIKETYGVEVSLRAYLETGNTRLK